MQNSYQTKVQTPTATVAPVQIMQVPKLLMSVSEACAALGMGKNKMYFLLKQGVIKSFGENKSRRIPLAELNRYVEQQMSEASGNSAA